MTSERRRIGTTVAFATAVLLVMLAVRPVSVHQLLAVYVLVLAAVALAALTRAARAAADERSPSAFEMAIRVRAVDQMRPPELVRTERDIVLGTSSARQLELRLLPILRDAASARLSARHNVDLVRRPDAARALLGDDAWDLLRPDRPEALDRNGPGITLRALRSVVARLESL